MTNNQYAGKVVRTIWDDGKEQECQKWTVEFTDGTYLVFQGTSSATVEMYELTAEEEGEG